jgi:hypothetical protein
MRLSQVSDEMHLSLEVPVLQEQVTYYEPTSPSPSWVPDYVATNIASPEDLWITPKTSNASANIKVLPISKTAFESNNENECGICFESSSKGLTMTTDCGHEYCVKCWHTWYMSHRSCPTCRNLNPLVTYYKVKESKCTARS